jgi:hypothetical protein
VSMMMRCSRCRRVLAQQDSWSPAASMSGSSMGDEHIESWFSCDRCGVYTVEVYHDRFLGEDETTVRGPMGVPGPNRGGGVQAQVEASGPQKARGDRCAHMAWNLRGGER